MKKINKRNDKIFFCLFYVLHILCRPIDYLKNSLLLTVLYHFLMSKKGFVIWIWDVKHVDGWKHLRIMCSFAQWYKLTHNADLIRAFRLTFVKDLYRNFKSWELYQIICVMITEVKSVLSVLCICHTAAFLQHSRLYINIT